MYRYIIDGKKLVLLDDRTMLKYIGKTVKMRSVLYCTSDKRCNICAGELYYKLGIQNIGLTAAKVGSNLLNMSMKSFHDSTVKVTDIKAENILLQ